MEALLRRYIAAEPGSAEWHRARDLAVKQSLPYVKKIAHGLARRATDPVEDLIQVGTIGLLKALDKFNPLAGTSFRTYATYFITGEIRHYLRDKANMIKAPRQMYELYYRMNQIVQILSDELGRTPTDAEIAAELECPVHRVNQVQEVDRRRQMISLDTFLLNESGDEGVYLERLVDERNLEFFHRSESRMVIDQALDDLSPELSSVVRLSYFEDLSQTEIAARLGISQMQVSRRLRKALDLLSKALAPAVSPGGGKNVESAAPATLPKPSSGKTSRAV
jgi:RNA polymerase sigma-B factor